VPNILHDADADTLTSRLKQAPDSGGNRRRIFTAK
jgi:hypothetical protein